MDEDAGDTVRRERSPRGQGEQLRREILEAVARPPKKPVGDPR